MATINERLKTIYFDLRDIEDELESELDSFIEDIRNTESTDTTEAQANKLDDLNEEKVELAVRIDAIEKALGALDDAIEKE